MTLECSVDKDGYDSWFQQVNNNVDVFNSTCWVDPADESQTKVAATAGNSYYVPAGKTALTPAVLNPRWS